MNKQSGLIKNKPIIALTALMVFIFSSGVGAAGWTAGLNIVTTVGLGAVVIGLMISYSRLPTLIAHLFSVIIGVGWSFFMVSRLLLKNIPWLMRREIMMDRIQRWLTVAVEGGLSYDNLMFIFQMSLIIWLAGYLTIWLIFRAGKVWQALLPGGGILLIVFHYAPNNLSGWVYAFLGISLLLIIQFNLAEHALRWRARNIYFRSDIGFDFFREGLVFSLIIITLAWLAPAVEKTQTLKLFDRADREWRSLQNEWNRMFANLDYKPDSMQYADNFSQSLALGGARTLTSEPVMTVKAPGGRYWRAVVFDEYDGQGWRSNDQTDIDFNRSGNAASLPFYRRRMAFTQTYTFAADGPTVLYAMSYPVSVNRSALARTTYITPEETQGSNRNYWPGKSRPWLADITYIASDSRLRADESYQVVSLISVATTEQLQQDDTAYPNWIKTRYTQLPAGIPQRVFDLAAEITAQAGTPYDKASAVETWLRENIAYNEGIDIPPPDRDKVDYILFDLKQAYCDYYATSMIVMLRSLGIPARLAAGYARGTPETLDSQELVYFVQNKDAHSWVEVFFPSYGWVEFEPTAAQPVIVRQEEDPAGNNGNPDRGPNEDALNPLDQARDIDLGADSAARPLFYQVSLPFWGDVQISGRAVTTAVGGIVVVMIGLLIWGGLSILARQDYRIELNIGGDGIRLQRRPRTTAAGPSIDAVYLAMIRLAAWLGFKKLPTQTPYEHAGLVGRRLPAAKPEVDLIAAMVVEQMYSRRHQPSEQIQAKVLAAWNKARPIFYRAVFEAKNPLHKITGRIKW